MELPREFFKASNILTPKKYNHTAKCTVWLMGDFHLQFCYAGESHGIMTFQPSVVCLCMHGNNSEMGEISNRPLEGNRESRVVPSARNFVRTPWCSELFQQPLETMTQWWAVLLQSEPRKECNGEDLLGARSCQLPGRLPDFFAIKATSFWNDEGPVVTILS